MTTRPNLHIRNAQEPDHAAMRVVTLAAYMQYTEVLPPPAWALYRRNIEVTLDGNDPMERIVAEQDGAIVGSVLLYPPGLAFAASDAPDAPPRPWPEVRLLAVDPAARGQGVGRALMQECLHRARAAGATELALHTIEFMHIAMRMYEQMGFERAPETDMHPAPGIVVKGYRRRLDDIQ